MDGGAGPGIMIMALAGFHGKLIPVAGV